MTIIHTPADAWAYLKDGDLIQDNSGDLWTCEHTGETLNITQRGSEGGPGLIITATGHTNHNGAPYWPARHVAIVDTAQQASAPTESVSGYRPDAWAAIQWLKPLLEPEAAATRTPGNEWAIREAEAHLAIIRLYEDADRHPDRYAGPEIIDALADVIEAIAYIYHPRLKLPEPPR